MSVRLYSYDLLKSQLLKEDRLLLLQAWRDSETDLLTPGVSTPADVTAIDRMMPKKVKMRRMAMNDENVELGWEEYYDYIFPDDEKKIGMPVCIVAVFAYLCTNEFG